MDGGVGDASRGRPRLIVLLAALAVVNAVIVVIRVLSLRRGALWMMAPNAEGMNVYALWKLLNGYPLYETTGRPFLPFTPYNFLFYYSYAALMKLLGVSGPGLTFWARIPTLASAALGTWILYATTVRMSLHVNGVADRALIALLSFVAWFGCAIVGWSAVCVRPDVPAALTTIAAVSVVLRVIESEQARWVLMMIAGLLFAATWSIKHAYIASFVGTVLYMAAVRRNPSELTALVLPYVCVIAVAFRLGSPGYAYAIFAQGKDPVLIHEAQFWLRAGLLPNLLVWVVPASGALAYLRRWRRDGLKPPAAYLYLLVVIVCVSAFTLLIIGKVGADEHYLIEATMMGTLWAGCALSSGAGLRLASWSAVPMLLFVVSVLTRFDLGRVTIGLRARGDRLVLGIPGELERRQAIAAKMATLPAPLYIDDQTLAQPWFANRGRFPSPVVIIEPFYFTGGGRDRGVTGEGMTALIADGYFRTLLLHEISGYRSQAVDAGYRRVDTIAGPAGGQLEIYTR